MPKWRVEGYDGSDPTEYSRQVVATEVQLTTLLEPLAAKHLSEDEITEATLGGRTDLRVHRDKQRGRPVTLTIGWGLHYVAIEEVDGHRT
jgi:hypothetical protein